MTPPVGVRISPLGPAAPVASGGRERDWKPAGGVRSAAVPEAGAGARDGDLLPVARLAEGSAALAPPRCRAMPVFGAEGGRVENADLLLPAFVVRLPDAFLALPTDPVCVRTVGLLALPGGTSGRALKGWGMDAPRCRALRLPRVPDPHVRWGGDAVLSRMALTRRGLAPPPDVPLALAFAAEGRRLAEAAGLPPGDVTLLGVYPGVPILAVSRLVVADAGSRLHLWLKPDVLRSRNGARLITLLVGRQTSSGKMLQAAL